MKKEFLKNSLLNLGIVALYIATGKFGLSFAFANPSTTAIWAPTGIALAAMLIFGKKVIPAIFLGAFFVNFTIWGTLTTPLVLALGNTLEALIAAFLVKKFANGIHAFESVADIFKFTFLAALLSTTVSANIGVLTLILSGLASWTNFFSLWMTWWLGDMGGSLVITPFILVWWTHHRIPLNYKKAFHFLLSLLCLIVISGIVFKGIVPHPYLCLPIAVWIAFWFGRRGATATTIIVALIAISYTIANLGPFADQKSLNHSLLLLQLFLNTYSLTALIFAAIVLEIRKSAKTLASREQRFQALIENSSDATVLIDASSKILYASPSVKRLLGYTPEELLGMTGSELIAPEDKKKTTSSLAALVLKPKSVVTTEYRVIRKDHIIIWVEATGNNLLLEPDVNAIVVNFHDITDKKLSQDKLLQEKMEDEAMLSSIGEGIIATDYKGEITMVNHATCAILGWKEKELIGKNLVEAIPMQDETGKTLASSERPITKVLSLRRSIVSSPTNYYVKKDHTKIPVRLTVTPIILADDIVGTIEVFYDITKEKEVDKAKSEFVSIASHQLRTPLATINWYLEELMRDKKTLDKKQDSYLLEVYSASKRMVNLINALLNVSRIELGTFMIESKKIDPLEIVKQTVRELAPQIKKKNIAFQQDYQKNLQPLTADAKLLTMLIENLLSNAIKYSRKDGKISLKVSAHKKELLFEVTDNGYGIPKSQESKIFTKMFRADNARSIEPEGNGLGLYIVKAITDATNGKIWFKSEENKGTSFFVSFPLTGMHQKEGQKLPKSQLLHSSF